MSAPRFRLCFVWLLALACPAGGACVTQRILVSGDDENHPPTADAQQLRRVEAQVAARRHLPFLRPVPADVMTVQQLREWFDRYADARKLRLQKDDLFHHRLGVLAPTVSTAEAYKGFIADFVGGVYDNENQRMVLVSDYAWWARAQQELVGMITGIDWAYEVFLAHELDHALQDQHFALGDILRSSGGDDNDDAAFVRKSLLESEANIVGMAHFLGMDLDTLATRKAFFLFLRYNNLFNGPILRALAGKTPSFFALQGLSQYELGLSFVERKLDEGGMDALSRAWVRPPGTPGALPRSTEQLLWPRKMRPESMDAPIALVRLDVPPLSLPGSTLVRTNVFGALAFKHLLEGLRGPLEAAIVADGWGGDRWELLDDNGHSVLVWRATWDSEGDAREFFDAWTASVPTRYGPRAAAIVRDEKRAVFQVPPAPEEKRFIRTGREERLLVEQRGRDVMVLEGARPETLESLAAEMWAHFVRGADPIPDEDRLAEHARRLEEQMREASSDALSEARSDARSDSFSNATSIPRADLLGRLFSPHRTMTVRMGTGIVVDAREQEAARAVFPVSDAEFRWGVRPGLELSLPVSLAAELRTEIGQTVARMVPTWEGSRLRLSLGGGHALPLGDRLAVVGQLTLADVSQTSAIRWSGGALMRPLDEVVFAPAIARDVPIATEGPSALPTVVLGGALQRGASTQPLLEIEVVDGLFLYESTMVFLEEKKRGLSLSAHSHVIGLLFVF